MNDRLKTRLERITLLIERGFTGDIETGKVYNSKGIENRSIRNPKQGNYLSIAISKNNKTINVYHHQFIWYLAYGDVVDNIDHINGIVDDNRIENLRSVTHQQNMWNMNRAKGYSWNNIMNKWQAQIRVNGILIDLGFFNLGDEHLAHKAYLDAKQKYHII